MYYKNVSLECYNKYESTLNMTMVLNHKNLRLLREESNNILYTKIKTNKLFCQVHNDNILSFKSFLFIYYFVQQNKSESKDI